jgi:hypothetical protein
LVGRTGPSKLALALLLKFYTQHGRFPEERSELHDAIGYVAKQVKVPAPDLKLFDWDGRTMERHRSAVRKFLGFRECSVPDAEKLTEWLADEVCCKKRRGEWVREKLLVQMWAEKIEPPTRDRIRRIIGAALRQSETTFAARISSRIPAEVTARMGALISEASDDPDTEEDQTAQDRAAEPAAAGAEVWASIRSDPGNISLKTMQAGAGRHSRARWRPPRRTTVRSADPGRVTRSGTGRRTRQRMRRRSALSWQRGFFSRSPQ